MVLPLRNSSHSLGNILDAVAVVLMAAVGAVASVDDAPLSPPLRFPTPTPESKDLKLDVFVGTDGGEGAGSPNNQSISRGRNKHIPRNTIALTWFGYA